LSLNISVEFMVNIGMLSR